MLHSELKDLFTKASSSGGNRKGTRRKTNLINSKPEPKVEIFLSRMLTLSKKILFLYSENIEF
jgi:hypothetical protein